MKSFGDLQDIADKIALRERLSFEDGLRLYRSGDLHALGELAGAVRERINGRKVFYSNNLHINHTNICSLSCLFCSFVRKPGESDAYAMSLDEIESRVGEALEKYKINEVHIVGGHNPGLHFDYYETMIKRIRALSSDLFIKALTAPEIDDLARRCEMSHEEVLRRLRQAGLNGLPGGGAEVFSERVRLKVCKEKITADEWLRIHEIAHGLGLKTNATLLYGHIENDEERVDHVLRLRELQDKTGGFESFILLAYNNENNRLEKVGEPGGILDLKAIAVSRLLLDNIDHIKCHWTTTDLKFAQVALSFGADDLGGTNLNEKIMHDAGNQSPVDLAESEIRRLISEAGYEPCLVDSSYKSKPEILTTLS